MKTLTTYNTQLKGKCNALEYLGANTLSLHKCLCGSTFRRTPSDVLRGRVNCTSCRYTYMASSRVMKERGRYDSKLLKRFGTRLKRIEKYVDGYTNILHKCSKHGKFSNSPNALLSTTLGCSECVKDFLAKNQQAVNLKQLRESLSKIKVSSAIRNSRGTIYGFNGRCYSHGKFVNLTLKTALVSKFHGCPNCAREHMGNIRTKSCKLGTRIVKVQGYEPLAIPILLKHYKPSDISPSLSNKISFDYEYKGNTKQYYPDFIILGRKLAVEVKSTYTLAPNSEIFNRNKAKRLGALDAGYRYRLMVFNSSERIIALPSNWHMLTYNKIRKLMEKTLTKLTKN